MNKTYRTLSVITLACSAVACGGGGTTTDGTNPSGGPGGSTSSSMTTTSSGGANGCLISSITRGLIEETTRENITGTIHTAKYAGPQARGFAIHLPGSKFGYVATATIQAATECPANKGAISYCESVQNPTDEPFWKDMHDRCVEFRCDGDIGLVDAYLTMQPKKKLAEVHAFSYETAEPSGTAIYNPNPVVKWRVDQANPDAIEVMGALEANVKITPDDGSELIDFTHTGTLSATRSGADVTLVQVDLSFPELVLGDPPLTVSVAMAGPVATGKVTRGDEVLATITEDKVFEWQGACAK